MNELAALSMIGGYGAALFLFGMVAIKVEERRRAKTAESASNEMTVATTSDRPVVHDRSGGAPRTSS